MSDKLLDIDSAETVLLSVSEAQELGEKALLKLGFSAEEFTAQLEELLTRIKGLPRQPGVSEIRIPSERGFREREIRRKQGILINKRVVERLQAM
jgi:LDH2 family malate/lactate/ureidoglycolate dehydrogenase